MFGNGKRHNDIQDRAEQIASEAIDSLRDVSRDVGRDARGRAEDVKKDAVKLLHNAADSIRHEARRSGANREVRESVDSVARGLEHAAHYLKRHSYEDMGKDMTRGVQANPWRTMAIIFVVGVLLGLMLRGDDNNNSSNGSNR